MSEEPANVILTQLRAIRNDLANTREEIADLKREMDEGFMRVTRDISGLSRQLRHMAADHASLDDRIGKMEDANN